MRMPASVKLLYRQMSYWMPCLLVSAGLSACKTEQRPPPPLNAAPMDASPAATTTEDVLQQKLQAALKAQPKGYAPRTEHFKPDGSPKYLNRLILETSPYLLQHAHNPVDWYPWGKEAFDRAGAEDKPILLSIGYSTCHWCHVMERESFEDEEIAEFINANFIAIKVDREERPDVDDIYMKAVQMFIGRGGWPMTTVLTPKRQPFFGGTYFPARDGDRGSQKGFLTILRELRNQYRTDRQTVLETAGQVSRRIAIASQRQRPGAVPGPETIEQTVRSLAQRFDEQFGGFGRAPKFPTPVNLELMFRYHRRTGDERAKHIAVHTLTKMAHGGMYDHVAGGFHRYSTDRRWLVPHFEKMLYDNAQLVPVYLDAYQLTRRPIMKRISVETLTYILREMTNAKGAFFSATDADSPVPGKKHQEEGWYFTWTPQEVRSLLDPREYALIQEFYGLTRLGNFEGRNILNTRLGRMEFAAKRGMSATEFDALLTRSHRVLYGARQQRAAPLRDEKVIASWNGLMISAFAKAGFVLGSQRYLEAAKRSADFILTKMRTKNGGLYRTFMLEQARHPGVLDDYAFVIQGLLDLFESTSDVQWLDAAIALQTYLDTRHWDSVKGGYYMTGSDQEKLLSRDKPNYDGAEPSGNSISAMNLLRLTTITGQSKYRRRAERLFSAFSSDLNRRGRGLTKMLSALDYYLDEPFEIAVISKAQPASALVQVIREMYLPNRVLVIRSNDAQLDDRVPWLEDKAVFENETTVFVCKQGQCERPTDRPAELSSQLSVTKTLYPDRSAAPIAAP